MSNVLKEDRKQQVLVLGRMGCSLREIEKRTGVRRETASGYLQSAGIAVRSPGGWGRQEPSKPANEVPPDSALAKPANGAAEVTPDPELAEDTTASDQPDETVTSAPAGIRPSTSHCEPYRETIEVELARGRNAKGIWQDLVDKFGFRGGYQSVKRFVRRVVGSVPRQPCAVIVTPPGEEAQVDYGTGPRVRDPKTGKYRTTRLFVMTLGYSRKSVRLLTFHSSSQVWVELHERAFRRLGGCPRLMVLDNLREGVLKADIWDPRMNPLYRDLLAHFGVAPMPCRPADPDRKGKVESGVGHTQKTPLKGKKFESLEEGHAYLDHWEERWADTRIHGTTKRQVAVMFAEEKPHLLPLPLEPFRHYQYGKRTVHLDGCVEVNAAYYSTPPGWIGRQVQVQWDHCQVRILHPQTGQLLREHRTAERGRHRIKDEDKPKYAPQGTQQLLARAAQAGQHVGTFAQTLHQLQGQLAIRRIQGLLALAKKYGAAVVDEACAAALELEAFNYHFVRRYLERGPQLPLDLRQIDPLIRQLTEYRDVIDNRTKGESTDELD